MTTDPALPGLYVHTPFCVKKCSYCDFYSVASFQHAGKWLDALEKETRLYDGVFGDFDTLYFGGGTPGALDPARLAHLMDIPQRSFRFHPNTEITMELNPEDVGREGLRSLREAGVNRISIGAQSFDDRELKFLGRRHTADKTREALRFARDAGFGNIGLDLIYGLPGQELSTWRKTLEEGAAFFPEHLSCYQLTLERKTRLGALEARGEIVPIDEERAGEFFLFTSEFLQDHGYIHYEVSNFARGMEHVSRHNSKYWRHIPYLGLGPSAHSFRSGVRWWNVRSLEKYIDSAGRGLSPVDGEETLDAEQLRLERIFLGLRTLDGVPLRILGNGTAVERLLTVWEEAGLVTVRDGAVMPTRNGFLVADALSRMLDAVAGD